MIDPSKDKFAYFKDNIQTAEDKEEFDASQYYYNRDDLTGKPLTGTLGGGAGGAGAGLLSLGLGGAGPSAMGGVGTAGHLSFGSPFGVSVGTSGSALGASLDNEPSTSALHSLEPNTGMFSGFNSVGIMGSSANSFAGAASTRPGLSEAHRMNTAPDHLSAVVKGRSFPSQADNKPPDMSEFPALGSRLGSMTLDGETVESRLRSAPSSSEFVIQKEDFPALSAFAPGSVEKEKSDPSAGASSSNSNFFSTGSGASATINAIGTRSSSGGANSLASASLGGGLGANAGSVGSSIHAASAPGSIGVPTSSSRTGTATNPVRASSMSNSLSSSVADMGENGKFGLVGLFHSMIVRSKSAGGVGNDSGKRNFLSVGYDLTSLGLNLNSAETLHPSFASPWSETPVTKERQFTLPSCYYHQPPVLKTTHLTKFHLETLFYIFYAMPKDVLQAYAAQELYARDWRYHGELQLWLKRATSAEISLLASKTSSATSSSSSSSSSANASSTTSTSTGAGVVGEPIGSSSSFATSGGGHGAIGGASGASGGPGSTTAGSLAAASSGGALGPQYVYFDTTTWERRVFTAGSISGALLSEEDIRVKLTPASS